MPSSGSISVLIGQLKEGDHEAARKLWERYFRNLVPLANRHLDKKTRRIADGEDIVLNAFASFCERARRGEYSGLQNRGDLWSLLAAITIHKATDASRRENRQRRGAQNVLGEAEVADLMDGPEGLDGLVDLQPTPDAIVAMMEELHQLLGCLKDDTLRTIAVLRMQDYTVKEIAKRLDCVTRTVERKLEHIRRIWVQELVP